MWTLSCSIIVDVTSTIEMATTHTHTQLLVHWTILQEIINPNMIKQNAIRKTMNTMAPLIWSNLIDCMKIVICAAEWIRYLKRKKDKWQINCIWSVHKYMRIAWNVFNIKENRQNVTCALRHEWTSRNKDWHGISGSCVVRDCCDVMLSRFRPEMIKVLKQVKCIRHQSKSIKPSLSNTDLPRNHYNSTTK